MPVEHCSRAKIIDVREQRRLAAPLEFREDSTANQVVLEGYAATYEPYDCYGGVDRGGWVETIDRRAFDITLAQNPDVQLLLNHEGLPLARTTSGTLKLSADNRGLKVRAILDSTDPDVQRILPKMRRGDLNEMSFAFRVKDQKWDTDYNNRLITEVSLQRGDVSVVSYGMNPDTKAILSQEAVGALARMSEAELVELRSVDRDEIKRAIAALSRAAGGDQETRGDEISIPAAGVSGPKRSDGDPKANMISSTLIDPIDEDTSVGEVEGHDVASGAHSIPEITSVDGTVDGPVKFVKDPAESSPSMTLVATLESTIVHAYAAASASGDEASRALLADAVAQVARLRLEGEKPKSESAVERALRELRGDSDPNPPHKEDDLVDSDDDEDEETSERGFVEESVKDEDDDPAGDAPEEDDPEKERVEDSVRNASESEISAVERAWRELRSGTDIPEINSVTDGLAYISSIRRGVK